MKHAAKTDAKDKWDAVNNPAECLATDKGKCEFWKGNKKACEDSFTLKRKKYCASEDLLDTLLKEFNLTKRIEDI